MNLFIYGDSSSIDDFKDPRTYLYKIKEYFGSNPRNFSVGGSSLDFTQTMVSESCHEWSSNDIVIVVLSHSDRTWIIEKEPSVASFAALNNVRRFPREFINHVEWYFGEVKNPRIDISQRNHFIRSLSYLANEKNLRSLVLLEGFNERASKYIEMPPNIVYSEEGCFGDISRKELNGKYITSEDTRKNHINFENHEIVANKIISAIENKRNFHL